MTMSPAAWTAFICSALALPAAAQTGPEAAVLPRLIAHDCIDLVRDLNGCEQVTLLESETDPDTADLLIYPDRRTDDAEGPLLAVPGIAFDGAMWGMAPGLEPVPGGFVLTSEQTGIGRFPWGLGLTIAHDGTDFVVTQYSYGSYDRMTGRSFTCELDFETGAWRHELVIPDLEAPDTVPDVVIADEGTGPAGPRPLAGWSAYAALPEPCAEASAGLWSD